VTEVRRAEDTPPSWAGLMAFGLATRAATVVAALVLAHVPERYHIPADARTHIWDAHLQAIEAGPCPWVEPFYRWDAFWYADISARGYFWNPAEQSSVAFLPLLPLVMAAGAAVGLDRYLIGVLVPNLMFAVGCGFFGRAVFDATGRRRTAWWAVVLLCTFPFALFYSLPYQESLAFPLVSAALWLWQRHKPGAAALTFLACMARMTATAFAVGVAVEFVTDWWRGRSPRWSAALVGAAAAVGVAAFFAYLGLTFGDSTLHVQAHAQFGRQPPSLAGLWRSIVYVTDPRDIRSALPQTVIMYALLAAGVRAWVRRGPVWACLILIPVLQGMASGNTGGMQRIALSAFPFAVEAADLLADRRLRWVWVAGGVACQVWLIGRYTHNGFVG
jgi:hypothetical protein